MIFGRKKKIQDYYSLDRNSGKNILVELLSKDTPKEILTKPKERFQKNTTLIENLEKLYRLEPLVFSGVNLLKRQILSPFFLSYPQDISEEERQIWEDFIVRTNLRQALESAVTDALVTGNGYLEIVYNKTGDDIVKFIPIDPAKIDFKRENNITGDIVLDEYGEPEGYIFINKVGETKELPRDRVVHVKFFTLGDDLNGISPLEPIYKSVIIKLNLEESYGEAKFRSGFPIYIGYVGDDKHPEAPAEVMEKLAMDLNKAHQKSAFVFPYYFKIERLEGSDFQIDKELDHFVNMICAGLGIPKGLLVSGRESDLDIREEDFRKQIASYQEKLSSIIKEQIFKRFKSIKNLKTIPDIVWRSYSSQSLLSRARRIGVLARAGLIQHDKTLENYLRKEEGLPEKEIEIQKEDITQ